MTIVRIAHAEPQPGQLENGEFQTRGHLVVLADDAGPVIPDPVTGAIVPGKTILKTYRLEGNYVRRVAAPGTPTGGEAHPEPVEKKESKQQAKAKKKR